MREFFRSIIIFTKSCDVNHLIFILLKLNDEYLTIFDFKKLHRFFLI